jgi:cell division protein FtsA
MRTSNNIVAGLDLGTTKVGAVIASENEGRLDIRGFGVAPSEGLNRGLVANIAKTAEAIREAMDMAMNRADVKIKEVNVGVAGEHIRSLRHRNYVTINNPENEISESDLKRLKDDVRTIRIPSDKQILHIIPEVFYVDNQEILDNPVGMCGTKLEALNHVVLASTPAIQNIRKSVERAGFSVKNYILQPIASSMSVLEENEMDLGVALIDIGGGTTDVVIYHRKTIKYTKVLGIAGNQVTNDIRETLGIITSQAEELKKEYGYATEEAIINNEDIYIQGPGGRGNIKIEVSLLTQIINMRMKELFGLIDHDLKQSGFKRNLKAGIVLTGGGSLLRGSKDLAEEVFGLPARLGVPLDLGAGLSREIEKPEFATLVGLIKNIPGVVSNDIYSPKYGKKSWRLLEKLKEFFDEL